VAQDTVKGNSVQKAYHEVSRILIENEEVPGWSAEEKKPHSLGYTSRNRARFFKNNVLSEGFFKIWSV
jgi:hypothetical protein